MNGPAHIAHLSSIAATVSRIVRGIDPVRGARISALCNPAGNRFLRHSAAAALILNDWDGAHSCL